MALIKKLAAIADAIREKNGVEKKLSLDEMALQIKNFSGGGLPSIITPGDTPVLFSEVSFYGTSFGNGPKSTGIFIDIPRDGTYRFKFESDVPAHDDYPGGTYLYRNGESVNRFGTACAVSSAQASFAKGMRAKVSNSIDIECSKGDRVEVYVETSMNYATGYKMVYAYTLFACVDMG